MRKQSRQVVHGVSRRSFIRKAAVGAGAAVTAGARTLEGSESAQLPPATPPAIRIPAELAAASAAEITDLTFPMTGAQVFARACQNEGVAALFCCPGNYGVTHAIANSGIPTYSGRHEGAMAHAADAFIRVTGEIAVTSDKVGEALGAHGEYVTRASDLRPALARAWQVAVQESRPAVVNCQGRKEFWLRETHPPGMLGKIEPGCMSYYH